jgi:hypothetical protein
MAWTTPRTYVTGEVTTAAQLNTHVRDNMKELWREVAYAERTSNLSVTATTEVSANTIVTAGSYTPVVGGELTEVEFFCPQAQAAGGITMSFAFFVNGSSQGICGQTSTAGTPVFLRQKFTPSGALVWDVRAWVSSGTGTVVGGGGGSGNNVPCQLRVMARGA